MFGFFSSNIFNYILKKKLTFQTVARTVHALHANTAGSSAAMDSFIAPTIKESESWGGA